MPPVESWVGWLAQGGFTGVLIWGMVYLHRSAVEAHSKRADDWHEIADLNAKGRDLAMAQLSEIVNRASQAAITRDGDPR